MIQFLQLPEEIRRALIAQASNIHGTSEQSIEKDWWITLTLQALFSLPMAEHFIFKGGTSLSKGWKLIERFSEDIDIALAPEAFGGQYIQEPSITYVKRLKKIGCKYTTNIIHPALEQQFVAMGVPAGMLQIIPEPVEPTLTDKDPQTIFVHYLSLFDQSYLLPPIKIEFGVRALREPFSSIKVQSILGEFTNAPAYQEQSFEVAAVEPRKTFMEKLMLLHEKFQNGRAEGNAGERQSRHLYDLMHMYRRGIHKDVQNDKDLYQSLLKHRQHYVKLRGVNYDDMQLSQLLFLPPVTLLDTFEKDYQKMQVDMIYGNPPNFDAMLRELRILNWELASVGHQGTLDQLTQQALQQIQEEALIEDFVQTTVSYTSNSFATEFLRTKDGYNLHRLYKAPIPGTRTS